MNGLFARHQGRHCRRGSWTGWSALSRLALALDGDSGDITGPRTAPLITPLVPSPMASTDYTTPWSNR